MNNPWIDIGRRNIHPDDRYYVDQHNRQAERSTSSATRATEIKSSLPPLPYIGNPLTARVILLGKNASFSKEDEADVERIPTLEEENFKALTFESEASFFYLDERFQSTNGYKWWLNVLGEVLIACKKRGAKIETVLDRIACVQYHPYRSEKSFVSKQPFPTQEYSFHLVNEAARSNDRIFVMQYGSKSEELWRNASTNLPADCVKLKNQLRANLSASNMESSDFDRIVKALCS